MPILWVYECSTECLETFILYCGLRVYWLGPLSDATENEIVAAILHFNKLCLCSVKYSETSCQGIYRDSLLVYIAIGLISEVCDLGCGRVKFLAILIITIPGKHGEFTYCSFNVGPASKTVGQR